MHFATEKYLFPGLGMERKRVHSNNHILDGAFFILIACDSRRPSLLTQREVRIIHLNTWSQ